MFNPLVADSFDEIAFHRNYPAHGACSVGDIKTVSMVLRSNPNLAVTEDCFKHLTPIHWAATFGRLDCIRYIASVEPNVINIQSSESFRTPLHCASDAGHPHCISWLLQAGANPEVKDIQGETALHKTARNGKGECVSLLLANGCNSSAKNSNGQTACMIAEHAGFPIIASIISQHEMMMGLDLDKTFGIQMNRLNRKRSRDVCDRSFKRMRKDDMPVALLPSHLDTKNPMITSVVDHERMCIQETGYNSFLESMFSEIHGC